ncbi:MAG TPA: alkaline phosphatase D family protein [Kofleriaceae bacterium]
MLTRRAFIGGSLATLAACRKGPVIATNRPRITHGVQSGDVSRRAVIWARCSEPARMLVEWRTSSRAAWQRGSPGNVVTPDSDLAGRVALLGLPSGQTIEYRVAFEREAARGISEWVSGRFAMPHPTKFRVVWTGDTCGQGFGRNPDWGGLRGYAAMRAKEPALFIHSGDMMYADNPILPEVKLPDGRVWRNVSNERVARVAEELADFRARFAYNLEDEHVRKFAAEVPVIASWDDHETRNNWWPGQQLEDPRYQRERDASKLAALARRALDEWNPLSAPSYRVIRYGPLLDVMVLDARTFRTANDRNDGDPRAMLGETQARWLVEALATSEARWKIVACDQPLALVIPDDDRHEGFANAVPGEPRGREIELANLLIALRERRVRNTVWLTADVHYAAAHRFDPTRSSVRFDPFWEFVAGPIHAGTFGPNELDPTLGPVLEFQWAPPAGTGNLAPWDGLQSFGTIDVTRDALSVALWGIEGRERYRVELPWTP